MKCEYYIEAESKEKAQQKFDAGEWEDCHEDFVATVDQTLTKIEVQE